jgi:hypothetical protein
MDNPGIMEQGAASLERRRSSRRETASFDQTTDRCVEPETPS